MNVLSLFDGMSCGRIALERAGIKVDRYYSSEIDKYAIQIADKNYPQDKEYRLGDVANIKGDDLPIIDLIIGGSPCQGFSRAGLELNFNDERSKLFFEFVRLIKECKPKYFFLENVGMKKEYSDIISEYLGVEPIEINSSLFSSQSRKRLYWTNIVVSKMPNENNATIKDIMIDWELIPKKYFMNYNIIKKDNNKSCGIIKVGDIPKEELKDNERQRRVYSINGISPTLLGRSDSPKIIKVGKLEMKASEQIKSVYSIDGISPTLDTCQGGHRQIKIEKEEKIRKLIPLECERLQTLNDNYTEGVSDTQRYKMIGNGWTVDVIAHIFKGLKGDKLND